MEVVLHVCEEELKEFPEEAPRLEETTTSQEQSGKVSQTQGTVQDLLSLSTSLPTCWTEFIEDKLGIYQESLLFQEDQVIGLSCSDTKQVSSDQERYCKRPGWL